jgi:glyoxylase-like metal-dependent hydrolase (beta-lactamase superfamily II)
MTRGWKVFAALGAALILLAALGLAFAPYVYAEAFPVMTRLGLRTTPASQISTDAAPGPALGVAIGSRWRVQQIAPDTYALGEPQNDPDNYEYLLLGKSRALLIDAGSSPGHDIRPVLATLTRLPVTVLPTHLHFDHTNGLRFAPSIALVDLPQTRARLQDGMVRLGRYQVMGTLGPGDGLPGFRVSAWIKPDSVIDLGGRQVRVLWTPGHTATSISVFDPAAKLLFAGDLIYPTSLYEFIPDSSLSAFAATADRLLTTLPADTAIYGAHCCRNDVPAQAPWLSMGDLRDAAAAVKAIDAGAAKGRGVIVRRFPVNSRMTLITLYPFGNR